MVMIRYSEGYAKAAFYINQCADCRINEYVPVLAGKKGRSSIANRNPFTSADGQTRTSSHHTDQCEHRHSRVADLRGYFSEDR